jgi:hypothetical protein
MKVLKLNSNPLANAPGIFRYAKQIWKTAASDEDRKTAVLILSSWDTGLTDLQLSQALAGELKTEMDDETVSIYVEE